MKKFKIIVELFIDAEAEDKKYLENVILNNAPKMQMFSSKYKLETKEVKVKFKKT